MATRKEMTKRLDKLSQTVQRCEGMWKKDGVWVSRCVTSGKVCPCFGKNCMQGGHFIPRGVKSLRWDERNLHPQCQRDNGFRNGAYIEYSNWFINRYGFDTYKEFMEIYEAHKQGKARPFNIQEIKDMYNYWLKKGRELEEKTDQQLFPKSWKEEK